MGKIELSPIGNCAKTGYSHSTKMLNARKFCDSIRDFLFHLTYFEGFMAIIKMIQAIDTTVKIVKLNLNEEKNIHLF